MSSETDKAKQITDNVNLLCRAVLGESSSGEEFRGSVNQVLQLISNPIFTTSETRNEFSLVQDIQKRLMKANKNSSAVQFVHLCQKLQKTSLNNRAATLRFLLSLNQHSKRKTTCLPLTAHISASSDPKTPQTVDSSTNSLHSTHTYKPAADNNQRSLQDWEASIPYSKDVRSGGGGHKTRISARNVYDPSESHLSTLEIIRDVIFALQGIDGQHISFDKVTEEFVISTTANIAGPQRDLVLRIAECGWLHNGLKSFYENGSKDPKRGLIYKAFCFAIQEELTEYYKYLSILHSQVLSESDIDQGVSASGSEKHAFVLTLRRLLTSVTVWKKKFLILTSIIDACRESHGGSLLTHLYKKTFHGDVEWRNTARNLLNISSRPLLTMLLQWIFEGVLIDPYQEFFITVNASSSELLWHDTYLQNNAMLPVFLTEDCLKKILLAGKSLNCIGKILNQSLVAERLETRKNEAAQLETAILFDSNHRAQLFELIDFVHNETSKTLLTLLRERFQLIEHIEAIKNYVLLSRGDFAQYLMDLLEPELSKPASQVMFSSYSTHLATVIWQTNARYEPPEVQQRLAVDILESGGPTGWDTFVLRYHTTGPLSIVVTSECLESYGRLYNFIWRIKRVSYVVMNMWRRMLELGRLVAQLAVNVGPVLDRFYILITEVQHFAKQVEYHFLFEVLECSWHEFCRNLRSNIVDLDEIIMLHRNYVDRLLEKSFLIEKYATLSQNLFSVIQIVFQIERLAMSFIDAITSECDARQEAMNRTYHQEDENQRRISTKQLCTGYYKNVVLIAELYQKGFHQLLSCLNGEDDDDQLYDLALRLDFSDRNNF